MRQRESSHRERVEMVEAKLAGMSLKTIAETYGYHRDTVRHWWRQYRQGSWQALVPRPRQRPERGPLSSFDARVRYVILRLKREHSKWGAELILLKLRQRPSLQGLRLPSRSAVAAYLQPYLPRLQGQRRGTLKRPAVQKPRITQVHECWQMDFKGDENLGNCGVFAPFNVVDSLTSAPLETRLYPASLKGVTYRDVQANLRQVFAHWGLPDYLRMDRGSVFVGSTRLEWPSPLLLWLVGLGVTPLINDPARPTQNAKVERHNLTWQNHVAIGANYPNRAAAQHACDTARSERLRDLPSRNPACRGRAPLLAQPQLAVPRRRFIPEQETVLFDMERVALYLADWRWLRTVDQIGAISLGNHNCYIGRQHCQQAVAIHYDLDGCGFVAYTLADQQTPIAIFEHPCITPDYIMGGTDDDGG